MTRQRYIRRTLAAICGQAPANPAQYHLVAAMADRVNQVCPFDSN